MSTPGERHLLVVDDDDRIRALIKEYLSRAGFRVSTARDAAVARRLLGRLEFDLLVVDVMMPGEDGFAFTRWLRARPGRAGASPVLILTARGLADERIEGLSLGADDYLAKPFEPRELVLRIEAILRRSERRPNETVETMRFGQCTFDAVRGELLRGAEAVRLTEAETRLLRQLAGQPNAAIDRRSLARRSAEAGGRAIDIQVTRLRRKIEPDPANPRYLLTVRGVGYMLAPD
ncbi:MAG TPA: response regulator [Caulobacteraceae bacterium]|nr:response regulator [Caulobacteraceae bacterium]